MLMMRMPSQQGASSGGLSSLPDDLRAPSMPSRSSCSGGAKISGASSKQSRAATAVRSDAVDEETPRPIVPAADGDRRGASVSPLARSANQARSPTPKPAPGAEVKAAGVRNTGLPSDFPDVPLPLVIKDRWKFKHRIGQGSFGAVFSGRDLRTKARVAAKLEPVGPKRSLLKTEVAVLKELQGTGHVCRYIASGCVNGFNYLVMELLADNLAQNFRTHRQSKLLGELNDENAKQQSAAAAVAPSAQAKSTVTSETAVVASEPEQQEEGRFTAAALTFTQVAFLGRQMIRAMQCLHEHGYLHRDVKPSNFALGLQPGTISTCYTIDFGLARRYVDANGAHLDPRPNPGFRGTARYASLNAHRNLELSRRDDLWSVFFIVFEFLVGVLPWAGLSARDEIGAAKEQWLVDSAAEGPSPICTLPHPLPAMFQALQQLEYADKPDYDAFIGLFDHAGPPEPMSDPSCDPPSDPITPASPPRAMKLAGLLPPAAAAAAAVSTVQAAQPSAAAQEPARETQVTARGHLCPRPPTHARPPSGRRGGRPPLLAARRNRFAVPQGTG